MPKVVFNIAYTSKNPPAKLSPERKAEYFARRKFYDMTAEYNYFSYVLDERKTVKNKDFLAYAEKSSGAFNLNGALSDGEKERIKADAAKTKSIIWHGVISFDAETSQGFDTQEKAVHFLKQSIGAFFNRTPLKRDNLEIVASLHRDTDNRHIHFAFFEKSPKRRDENGKLTYTQNGVMPRSALENYLVSANSHMNEKEGEEYYTYRDRALKRLQELRVGGLDKNIRLALARRRIDELSKKLPAEGRLQYASDNMLTLRSEIDRAADILIRSDPAGAKLDREWRAALAKKEAEAKEMCGADVNKQLVYCNGAELKGREIQELLKLGKTEYVRANKISWENIDYFEKLRQEYKERVGNKILALCKDMKKDFRAKNRNTAKFNDRQMKIKSRTERRVANKVFNGFMLAMGAGMRAVKADFSDRLHEVERQIQLEQQERAGG